MPDLSAKTPKVGGDRQSAVDENWKEKTFSSLKILSCGDDDLYLVGGTMAQRTCASCDQLQPAVNFSY